MWNRKGRSYAVDRRCCLLGWTASRDIKKQAMGWDKQPRSQACREMNYVSSVFPHSGYSHAFWFRDNISTAAHPAAHLPLEYFLAARITGPCNWFPFLWSFDDLPVESLCPCCPNFLMHFPVRMITYCFTRIDLVVVTQTNVSTSGSVKEAHIARQRNITPTTHSKLAR